MKGRIVKVLLTGCTAKQVSRSLHNRIPTFAGLMYKALTSQGVDVVWTRPDFDDMPEDYIRSFDAVLFGITSPASLSANYIYPALSVADYADKAGNLVFFVDAPEPHKIWAGIVSTIKTKNGLGRDFYARRRDFKRGTSPATYERLVGFLERLTRQQWPLTLAPGLPWTGGDFLSKHISYLAPEDSIALYLDMGMDMPTAGYPPRGSCWLLDDPGTPWSMELTQTLSMPAISLRGARKNASVEDMMTRLSDGVGTVVSTYRSGDPWWTPAIYISLNSGVPVVSDWRLTSQLGSAWNLLPVSFEEMNERERADLCEQQIITYMDSMPGFITEAERLAELILSKKNSMSSNSIL